MALHTYIITTVIGDCFHKVSIIMLFTTPRSSTTVAQLTGRAGALLVVRSDELGTCDHLATRSLCGEYSPGDLVNMYVLTLVTLVTGVSVCECVCGHLELAAAVAPDLTDTI